jgi:hypothetical protein
MGRGEAEAAMQRCGQIEDAHLALEVRHSHHLTRRRKERGLERLPTAGPLSLEERLHDGAVGVEPCGDVDEGDPDACRGTGWSRDFAQPCFGLHEQIVRRQRCLGPVFAVPRWSHAIEIESSISPPSACTRIM